MSTYTQFDDSGSGEFGQIFGYSVRPYTESFDGYSFLDKRSYDAFGVWFRRARTVRGRRLVAQKIICHACDIALFSGETGKDLKQQQSILNRFMLIRKHKKDSKDVHISKEFLYLRC